VAPAAGERPKDFRRRELAPTGAQAGRSRRRWRPRLRLSKIAPILVVLGLVGFGLGPGRQWINDHVGSLIGTAKQHVSQSFAPVSPVSATSSSAAPDHSAKLAIDGVSNTWWQSADTKDGIGQTITVKFANPTNIDRIAILSGVPGANFRTEARVRTMTVTVNGQSGAQIGFNDIGTFQNTSVKLRDVSSVTFVIVASYPGQSGHAIAITELEFDQLQ
jgi:F5/8 type C domain-containing protein